MRFSEKAERYEERAFVQADLAAWTAQWLDRLADLPGPALEVGAGTGLFTRHLVKGLAEVVATDASEAMVLLGKEHVPGASWSVHDAWAPRAGQWGGLFSSSLLQWCSDPVRTFSNWRELLLPGASMLHGFFLEGTLEELRSIDPGCLAVEFLPAKAWSAALEEAGFEVLEAQVKQVSYDFPSALELFRFLHGIGATLGPRRIKPSALRRIIEECDRQRTSTQSGQVQSQWVFGRFQCVRKA